MLLVFLTMSKEGSNKTIDLKAFSVSIDNETFASTTKFQELLRYTAFPAKMSTISATPGRFTDTLAIRAYLVFNKFGAVQSYGKCMTCGQKAVLNQLDRASGGERLRWECSVTQHHHWSLSVASTGILSGLRVQRWWPFLHSVCMMKQDYRIKNIYEEMLSGYGVHHQAVDGWKNKC